jgi:hypothetical protein
VSVAIWKMARFRGKWCSGACCWLLSERDLLRYYNTQYHSVPERIALDSGFFSLSTNDVATPTAQYPKYIYRLHFAASRPRSPGAFQAKGYPGKRGICAQQSSQDRVAFNSQTKFTPGVRTSKSGVQEVS